MIFSKKADGPIPAALIALAAIPVIAGVARLVMLITGGPISADNIRFFPIDLDHKLKIERVGLAIRATAIQFPPPLIFRARTKKAAPFLSERRGPNLLAALHPGQMRLGDACRLDSLQLIS